MNTTGFLTHERYFWHDTGAGCFSGGLLPNRLILFLAPISNPGPPRQRKNSGRISKPFGMIGKINNIRMVDDDPD